MERIGWRIFLSSIAIAALMAGSALCDSPVVRAADMSHPVFVELFTSEGCSSCPPADDLLAQIEQKIPNVVVLSEHVTYWNNGGWHDPFSSTESTARQADYVDRLGLSSSYTPQMVVNGTREFVGSDGRAAAQAIAQASQQTGVPVSISGLMVDANRGVSFQVETGPVRSAAQLLAVMAQDEGTKHVSNGENGGHTLRHVMIARTFVDGAKIRSGGSYSGRLTVKLPEAISGSGWHLVVFLQQGRGGPILGTASAAVQSDSPPSVVRGQQA
jgi:hypothetical protein